MGSLATWVTVYMLFGFCTGTQKLQVRQQETCPLPMDMAPNSVDYMYNGCEDNMKKKVKDFLETEKKTSKNFSLAWDEAEKYYRDKWKNHAPLEKEQIMAVHAYTINKPKLYLEFNNAVRNQSSVYKTNFAYHTLHFYLTMALRSLKSKAKGCVTTYRRTNCKFETAINKDIRLGAFTSSKLGSYPSSIFGKQSCFKITTCFGADISNFSYFDKEREVLIPAYEIFKVSNIKNKSSENSLTCDVVYELKSTNTTYSNLNCALFNNVNRGSTVQIGHN